MTTERPWQRWLLDLITPPKLGDNIYVGAQHLMLEPVPDKHVAIYARSGVATDHLIEAPPVTPAPSSPDPNSSQTSPTVGSDTQTAASSLESPKPNTGTVKRRPKVLNKVSYTLEDAMPTPPATPARATFRIERPRPTLATLEHAAGNALYFEQYYDALARGVRPRPLRAKRAKVDFRGFEVGRVIGQGAFGVVYIAHDIRRNGIVAIKQLRKTDLLRMGQEGHVCAEKDLLSTATSMQGVRWIPSLHCAFQDRDHLFLVLEYMGGGDLLTLLMARGCLPESDMRFYAAEMVLALHQVHKLGYIHRDVKPDNFLFNHQGHIRVADFGLATDLHWSHDSSYYEHQRRAVLKRHGVPLARPAFGNRRRRIEPAPNAPPGWADKSKLLSWRKQRRRMAYTICGTNSYMAPEVIRGAGYGFGADWWGLGIIVYEALYGSVPFMGNSREAARQKILDWKQNLKFPRSPRSSVLAIDFIRKLLCEPEDRLGYIPQSKRRGSFSAVPLLDEPLLGSDGVEQLMNHPWFFGIDWDTLHEQMPPYQPNLETPDDTQHFDDDIPNEPLAPANSALDLRDPLLGNPAYGPQVMAIRKELAFKGWTFRSPTSYDEPPDEVYTEPSASTRYADSVEPGYASDGDSFTRRNEHEQENEDEDEVVLSDDDDPDYEPYPRPYHESRQYPTYGRLSEGAPRPRVKSACAIRSPEPTYDSGYGSEEQRYATDGELYRRFSESTDSLALEREFDRLGELVKWQEIVKDSVAAEAALAAAAAAAAQWKRLSEMDGEGTPRTSEATVRASQRLKKALRARVSRVAS
ncbi:hypothetical protein CspHIS471_0109230 [Cutaneotrichosporon sp. HIS471]|nr:hypothetical protein CspHIS471_0109230 [Cutaneotrichosporon sp. HIS471]